MADELELELSYEGDETEEYGEEVDYGQSDEEQEAHAAPAPAHVDPKPDGSGRQYSRLQAARAPEAYNQRLDSEAERWERRQQPRPGRGDRCGFQAPGLSGRGGRTSPHVQQPRWNGPMQQQGLGQGIMPGMPPMGLGLGMGLDGGMGMGPFMPMDAGMMGGAMQQQMQQQQQLMLQQQQAGGHPPPPPGLHGSPSKAHHLSAQQQQQQPHGMMQMPGMMSMGSMDAGMGSMHSLDQLALLQQQAQQQEQQQQLMMMQQMGGGMGGGNGGPPGMQMLGMGMMPQGMMPQGMMAGQQQLPPRPPYFQPGMRDRGRTSYTRGGARGGLHQGGPRPTSHSTRTPTAPAALAARASPTPRAEAATGVKAPEGAQQREEREHPARPDSHLGEQRAAPPPPGGAATAAAAAAAAAPVEVDPEEQARLQQEERQRKLTAIRATREAQAAKNRELAMQRKRKIDELNAAKSARESHVASSKGGMDVQLAAMRRQIAMQEMQLAAMRRQTEGEAAKQPAAVAPAADSDTGEAGMTGKSAAAAAAEESRPGNGVQEAAPAGASEDQPAHDSGLAVDEDAPKQ